MDSEEIDDLGGESEDHEDLELQVLDRISQMLHSRMMAKKGKKGDGEEAELELPMHYRDHALPPAPPAEVKPPAKKAPPKVKAGGVSPQKEEDPAKKLGVPPKFARHLKG